MAQENREIVRAVYDAFNRGDWDEVFRNVHPEFEATFKRGPSVGTHRGREKVQAIFTDMSAPFDAFEIEPERLIDHEDRVVAIVRTRLRPKGTDAEIRNRNGWVWTLRDGKAVAMEGFPDADDALRSLGLDS